MNSKLLEIFRPNGEFKQGDEIKLTEHLQLDRYYRFNRGAVLIVGSDILLHQVPKNAKLIIPHILFVEVLEKLRKMVVKKYYDEDSMHQAGRKELFRLRNALLDVWLLVDKGEEVPLHQQNKKVQEWVLMEIESLKTGVKK